MFSANWRLPRHFTEEERRAQLEKTLEILDLTWIRNARIGNIQRRGISGGERKPVCARPGRVQPSAASHVPQAAAPLAVEPLRPA